MKFRSNLVEDLAILGTQELKKTTDIIKKMAIVTKCMFLNENLMENEANVCIGTNCTCIDVRIHYEFRLATSQNMISQAILTSDTISSFNKTLKGLKLAI